MARSLRAVALVAFLAVISQHAAALPISKGQGVSMPMSGVSLTNVLSRAFKPYAAKPPVEVAVPTVEWRPVTVLTPTLQVYKMGFCIPRNQWTAVSADAVDCPPQTYLQNNNGRVVCARTDCAGPVGKTVQPAAEQQQKTLLGAAYFAVKKSMPQAWGGTAAAICSTVFVQPIMACPQNCISDVRCGGAAPHALPRAASRPRPAPAGVRLKGASCAPHSSALLNTTPSLRPPLVHAVQAGSRHVPVRRRLDGLPLQL
ncbi:MAG: hypothetical protein J3K34DRAFT_399561 [Monoraphidium minutum]|nr:MAG: hypothetical protein J3K34DRAFT_399561 [Monoraphidium minutum]